jgi:predicted transcriptional regulator
LDANELRKLGLSQTEAALYLTLLKIGASSVQNLIDETGFYKANTYDALERLCEKGIISKIIEGKRRIYQLQKPNSLIEYIQKKKNELETQEDIAIRLARQVQLSKKHTLIQETAVVMRGLAGVKQVFSEIISEKLDYLSFGGPKESETIIGSHYWHNLHAKQKEFEIKAKMIFHKSLRNWAGIMPRKLIDLRFFDEEFEPLTETTIYGTKVAFIVWTDKPTVTIINNDHVSNSFRQTFNILWRSSKP